jgi:hypothetical protein
MMWLFLKMNLLDGWRRWSPFFVLVVGRQLMVTSISAFLGGGRIRRILKVRVTSPLGDVGLWGEFEGGWKISISLARRRFLLEKRLNVVSEFFRLSAYLTAIINRKIELGVRVIEFPSYVFTGMNMQYPNFNILDMSTVHRAS